MLFINFFFYYLVYTHLQRMCSVFFFFSFATYNVQHLNFKVTFFIQCVLDLCYYKQIYLTTATIRKNMQLSYKVEIQLKSNYVKKNKLHWILKELGRITKTNC